MATYSEIVRQHIEWKNNINLKKKYISDQFHSIISDDQKYKIQVISDQGRTNWLNINHDQLEKIVNVLIEG